ncbi:MULTISPECIES: protein TolR [unclassified Roseateles]|jgi:biopolymer transport protein TolR|nr:MULTISPECIES: protein TolR [unclassified Roseateles]MBB3281009.1 biopolymer transport protein TolR [Mitsuaria sp. BK037]MBB3293072.1 biopolymer transport protein TolR [Mitsuaria sp. BK041]MBB3362289.1 biopolymer transport protein TolR [Mitsuaria sp. BK045]
MPAMSSRGGSRRRTMNEINMVPFIDVMLVLLIIFMVSAPLITTGVVDLPSVGTAKTQPQHVIQVIVGTDEQLKIKLDGDQDPSPVPLKALAARVRDAQKGDAATPVVISADRNVKYEAVVKTMDVLQRAGIQRVGLAVKNGAPADR